MNTKLILSRRRLATALLFGCLAITFAMPKEAFAHARLLKSSPADGDAIKNPEHVDLWFSELLDGGGFNSIVVFPASDLKSKKHANLAAGDAKVDPKDRTHLFVDVKALPPGDYYVEWRVLSLDGHSAPGRFKFKVREAESTAATK